MIAPLRIALVNDHPLVLAGLREMLRPHAQFVEVVERDSLVPVSQGVDIALVDTYGQARSLPEHVRELSTLPHVGKVAVYAWSLDEAMVREVFDAGAAGVLSKRLRGEDLARGLLAVASGRRVVLGDKASSADLEAKARPVGDTRDWPGRNEGLSMREAEMITLICQGLTNDQIAERLYLTVNSVKSYIRTAYRKIGVTKRSEAVIWGLEHGMRPVAERQLDA